MLYHIFAIKSRENNYIYIMIRREYKNLKLFLVVVISLLATWQGKNNLAWFASQVTEKDCFANWMLIECQKR